MVALMVLAAVVRVAFIHGAVLVARQETPLLWQICLLPIIAALLVLSLYANGRHPPVSAGAKAQPSYELGQRLSIGCCLSLLLIQGLLILTSLDLPLTPWLGLPLVHWIGLAVVIAMVALVLQALDQTPKLPWFDRKLYPAGELGPIYGPRYMRARAKIWLLCLVILLPCIYAGPRLAWLSVLIAFAIAFVWDMTLQVHYGRRWKIEQSMTPDCKP
ncbi:hypothetical protein [Bradyrhizobium sp. SSBR45G]|nr:hypothetical protein [Bradyrhizobium sp. SSBR45G]